MTKPSSKNSLFERGADVLRAQLKTMPSGPGVYRMVGVKGQVLYVGKAKNLKKRVTSYTQQARLPRRIQRMVAQTYGLEIVVTASEAEALLLEANLIKHYKTPFNVLLRDDKSFPFIVITRDHPYPQLLKHRGAKTQKGWYYGPFASAASVNETLILLQRVFMLRNCSDSYFAARKRPCLQYHIKRCTAPCCGKVSAKDYAQQVSETRAFLSGHSRKAQKQMNEAMQQASDAMDYERAASLRDRIAVLTSIQSRQDVYVEGLGNADVIALHQEGGHSAITVLFFRADRHYGARTYFPAHDEDHESAAILAAFIAQFYADKDVPPLILVSEMPSDSTLLAKALGGKVTFSVPKLDKKKRLMDHAKANAAQALARKMAEQNEQEKLLQALTKIFHLPRVPQRIEVYDNSHIAGQFPVGVMIAAGPEGFLKKTYRKFTIKQAHGQDDFAMMQEVLGRRFKRLLAEDPARTSGVWPDLLLIDGGAGQVGKVTQALADLGIKDIPVIGIAKGPDRHAGQERFFRKGHPPLVLPAQDPVLYYLQRLRDEAHRMAIGTHRAKRAKAISYSGLEEISGIGARRKKALLQHFGSAKAIENARADDIGRVHGISAALAKKIYDYFHGNVVG
ncbi:MAG: excinuclease ABC subunit UvrC [Alphaproteobacteria bacterium]|nr:excinuclease ABC subunit UvrC [Alphaproteobacteria bacterium]